MKYAHLDESLIILKVSDNEIEHVSDPETVVQISNANADLFQAALAAFDLPVFYIDNKILTSRSKRWLEDPESIKDSIRPTRNKLLAESDWTQLADASLSEDSLIAWSDYRQQLRDMTDNINEEGNATFPDAP